MKNFSYRTDEEKFKEIKIKLIKEDKTFQAVADKLVTAWLKGEIDLEELED